MAEAVRGVLEASAHRSAQRTKEQFIQSALFLAALITVATTGGIIWVLLAESVTFFRAVAPTEFFLGTRWAPLLEPRSFGVLPLVGGTFLIGAGSLLLAVPIGLASALYLSEYASISVRTVAKPLLEVLAGIPTVVYGYFALSFVTPYILRPIFPQTEIFNAASAALVVGIMLIPTVASLADDALRAVPRTLRDAAYALAGTKLEVSTRVVLPAATSGVLAAVLLALGRALGETMAVSIAAGRTPKLTLNPLVSVETMTAYIVEVSLGDTPAGTVAYQTIFAVGLTLFLITMAVNLAATRVLARFREAYE